MKTEIKAADKSEEKLFYACDEDDILAAKIGHMRFDFGNGRQFYGTWFGGNEELNVEDFKTEFNEVTKILRSDLLKDRSAMGKFISENPSLDSVAAATDTKYRRTSIPTICGASRSQETMTVTASAMSVSCWIRLWLKI